MFKHVYTGFCLSWKNGCCIQIFHVNDKCDWLIIFDQLILMIINESPVTRDYGICCKGWLAWVRKLSNKIVEHEKFLTISFFFLHFLQI